MRINTNGDNLPIPDFAGFYTGHAYPGGVTFHELYSRGDKMSLCVVVPTKNELFIGIESRSVVPDRSESGKWLVKDDNTPKYYIVNKYTVVFCTGQNTFEDTNRSFVDEMGDLNLNELSLEDVLVTIDEKFSALLDDDKKMHITVCRYSDTKLQIGQLDVGNSARICRYVTFPKREYLYIISGSEWAFSCFSLVGGKDPIEFIKNGFTYAYKEREEYDNTIGGPVHIMKIDKDGYEWVEENFIID